MGNTFPKESKETWKEQNKHPTPKTYCLTDFLGCEMRVPRRCEMQAIRQFDNAHFYRMPSSTLGDLRHSQIDPSY